MKQDIQRIPEVLESKVNSEKPAGFKTVLGLDLGTSCGYAYCFVNEDNTLKPKIYAGQLDLSAGPYDSGAIRFIKLRHFLAAIKPDLVAFEDVKYTPPSAGFQSVGAIIARAATACEWFGALKATMATWCEARNIPSTGIPIGTIKKRATGKGNANKVDVINACNKEFGMDFETEGYESSGVDNIADAVYVCSLLLEQYGSGLNFADDAKGAV
jgi:Holliday junction resolvasome RuvABC endonuclease subunit